MVLRDIKIIRKNKKTFNEEILSTISLQTSMAEVWNKAFWTTDKDSRNKGLNGIIEEKLEKGTDFFDMHYPKLT